MAIKPDLLRSSATFASPTDEGATASEVPHPRAEPETPAHARKLHADDAKAAGLTEQSPTSDGLPKGRPQQARAPPELLDAYSIREFCRRHSLTPYLFYAMQRAGTAPRVMQVGGRKFISAEAAAKWRKARERTATPRPERGRKQPNNPGNAGARPGA